MYLRKERGCVNMVYKKKKIVYMTKERGCVNMVYKIKTRYVYMR